jgi:KaiC/GvpD/RAD55 family RecA-like ATPase
MGVLSCVRSPAFPFDLEPFNEMTKGGVPKKTLNIIIAGTNVGKSLVLCHFAGAGARMSHNVLYITLRNGVRSGWVHVSTRT